MTSYGLDVLLKRLLRDASCDATQMDEAGNTALHTSGSSLAEKGKDTPDVFVRAYQNCIRLLLTHPDVNIFSTNNAGKTALEIAGLEKLYKRINEAIRWIIVSRAWKGVTYEPSPLGSPQVLGPLPRDIRNKILRLLLQGQWLPDYMRVKWQPPKGETHK